MDTVDLKALSNFTFLVSSTCAGSLCSGIVWRSAIRSSGKGRDMTDSTDMPVDPAALLAELQRLRIEHKDISDAVDALEAIGQADQLQIRRFKRRKLLLKDLIRQIEDQITPDIIA